MHHITVKAYQYEIYPTMMGTVFDSKVELKTRQCISEDASYFYELEQIQEFKLLASVCLDDPREYVM